jgi:hypothetical protein
LREFFRSKCYSKSYLNIVCIKLFPLLRRILLTHTIRENRNCF